jgi:hypothetical protein
VKKQTLWFALLLSLAPGVALGALDSSILRGRDDRWEDFDLDHLEGRPGRWGTMDLFLSDNRYEVTPATDLLLHFDAPIPNTGSVYDETGHYQINEGRVRVSERVAAMGAASAAFSGGDGAVHLRALSGALLETGTWWGDFSIEFWLYSALLADGEQILSWAGSRWQGSRAVSQGITCLVDDRRLSWSFENFFVHPDGSGGTFVLHGLTPMIPRTWHHHLVRYDSTRGMLEYLVDGILEAVLYTTSTGGERGDLLLPATGDARSGELQIGRGFVGFLDELRITRGFVDEPSLTRYSGRTGVAVSSPFDLGYTGTRVKRIEAVYDSPADSEVYFFFRLSDRWDLDENGEPWKPFNPGQELTAAKGRYLQLMVELFPDGRRSATPQVSELRVVYEQDLPPPPPTGLYAVAHDGAVELYWNTVNEEDVRGYMVYYGEAPGNYHGSDSELGPSPLDVGNVSRVRITGLRNRKLYYFSVVAYDATVPPHRSLFSKEISARPAELYASSPPAGEAVR